MLKEHGTEYRQSLALLPRDRANMSLALAGLPGLVVFLSQANFLLVKPPDEVGGVAVREQLLAEHNVFVRDCGNKLGSSSRFLRLVVRPHEDVQRLLTGLGACLRGGPADRACALASLSALERFDAEMLLPGHGPVHHGTSRAAAAPAREQVQGRGGRQRPCQIWRKTSHEGPGATGIPSDGGYSAPYTPPFLGPAGDRPPCCPTVTRHWEDVGVIPVRCSPVPQTAGLEEGAGPTAGQHAAPPLRPAPL
jgi:hypothetical protein